MMVTNTVIPMFTTLVWIIVIALLGVLFAFPSSVASSTTSSIRFLKAARRASSWTRCIPGTPRGHVQGQSAGQRGVLSALAKLMQSHAIMAKVKLAFLSIPEFLDGWVYKLTTLKIAAWTCANSRCARTPIL